MSEPQCENCRFFEPRVFNGVASPDNGRCRRRAPRPWNSTNNADEPIRTAWWPIVATDEWCGEHEPAKRTDARP